MFSKDQPFTSSSSDEARDNVGGLHGESESGVNLTTDYMSSAVSVSATSTSMISMESDEENKLHYLTGAFKSKVKSDLKTISDVTKVPPIQKTFKTDKLPANETHLHLP